MLGQFQMKIVLSACLQSAAVHETGEGTAVLTFQDPELLVLTNAVVDHIPAHEHVCMCMHTHNTPAHARMCRHTRHSHARRNVHACARTNAHACIRTRTREHICTCARPRAFTHPHIFAARYRLGPYSSTVSYV